MISNRGRSPRTSFATTGTGSRNPSAGLSLERADGLVASELHGHEGARTDAGCTGSASAPCPTAESTRRCGMFQPQLRAVDLSRFASPVDSIFRGEKAAISVLRLRTSLARDHFVREQAIRSYGTPAHANQPISQCCWCGRTASGRRGMTTGDYPEGERPNVAAGIVVLRMAECSVVTTSPGGPGCR